MLVNKYSGRTFNDLSQYPVFPWVIKEWNKAPDKFEELVEKKQVYRDMSKLPSMFSEVKK